MKAPSGPGWSVSWDSQQSIYLLFSLSIREDCLTNAQIKSSRDSCRPAGWMVTKSVPCSWALGRITSPPCI